MAWLGRLRRRGVSEALAVLVLTLVMIVGVLLAASLGARMLNRLNHVVRAPSPRPVLDYVYVDPSACWVNVTLYFPSPTYLGEAVLVLNSGRSSTYYIGEVIQGEYVLNAAVCGQPTALALITDKGTEVFNLT